MTLQRSAVLLLVIVGVVATAALQEERQAAVIKEVANLHARTTPAIALSNSYPPTPVRTETRNKLSRSLAHLLDFTTPVKRDSRSCFPYNTAELQANLDTCCWYNSATCCSPQIAALVIPSIKGNLSQVQQEIGLGDDCYFAIADLVCMICSPNTADFISRKVGTNKPSIQVHICDSLCNKMFSACKPDLSKLPGMAAVTNGEQFCSELFREAHQSGNIVFDPKEEKSCYDGVPLDQVEKAYCLPHQSKPSSDDGYDGSTIALIVVPIVVAVVMLLGVGAGVAGFLWHKKRKQEKVQMDIALASLND